ncbi:hypothetical protein An15g02970 [Aspergillus niger]|uniref:Uncharacterized protein n=2 Tax=Aspergillus niger TaxID=5061 RepID=A2R577_ASPNC|nr:hypothetical protein An15g02970 [Aspergillus niger]CAK42372.1 hypothetical protein An15g02970 [Aspergillus niger]
MASDYHCTTRYPKPNNERRGYPLQKKDEARASVWTTVYVLRANPDTIQPHGTRIPEPCSAVIKTRKTKGKQAKPTRDSRCSTT